MADLGLNISILGRDEPQPSSTGVVYGSEGYSQIDHVRFCFVWSTYNVRKHSYWWRLPLGAYKTPRPPSDWKTIAVSLSKKPTPTCLGFQARLVPS